jgi:hypothetical protein
MPTTTTTTNNNNITTTTTAAAAAAPTQFSTLINGTTVFFLNFSGSTERG